MTNADDLVEDYQGGTIVSMIFCGNLALESPVKTALGHEDSPASTAREQCCDAGGTAYSRSGEPSVACRDHFLGSLAKISTKPSPSSYGGV